jgi:hypothetical protein
MSYAAQAQSRLEKMVADRYRQAGYDVILRPESSMFPFDLRGYRPDLIAKKGGSNLIIEVRSSSNQASYERLREVVEEVRRHSGWQFVLVTDRDVSGARLPDDYNQVSWVEVEEGIRSADKLKSMGEHEAAYLLLWIAFERTLRIISNQADLPSSRQAPGIIVRELYSAGELSMEQYDAALSCLEVRNRVVHGFPTADVSIGYERLRELLSEMLSAKR